MKQLKAIFIDSANRTVSEIQLDATWRAIAPQIGNGCETFCCPVNFENEDTLYADDESLLKDELTGGFLLNGFRYPIVGNALILGTNEEGESVDCKTNVSDIVEQIRFIYHYQLIFLD